MQPNLLYRTVAVSSGSVLTLSQNPALNLSLACLMSDTTYLRSTYTAALMAYTFSLAGKRDKRAELMARLNGLATANGKVSRGVSAHEESTGLSTPCLS